MTTMQGFRKMAAAMDQRVQQLATERVSGPELLHRMAGYVPDLQQIWVGADDRELGLLCQEYPGFYRYASLMEEAFEEERRNPKQRAYGDLPELEDSLKRPLSELLTAAATLERGYQSVISANRPGVELLGELNRLHDHWLVDRERFVAAVRAASVPQKALDFVASGLGEMADRIAELKRRILMP